MLASRCNPDTEFLRPPPPDFRGSRLFEVIVGHKIICNHAAQAVLSERVTLVSGQLEPRDGFCGCGSIVIATDAA